MQFDAKREPWIEHKVMHHDVPTAQVVSIDFVMPYALVLTS